MAKRKRVPWGRMLMTRDDYLGQRKTPSQKKRPVVVIETNERNELAVVPLSSRDGKHHTHLLRYQDGGSYYKHFVEIEDNEGKAIKVGPKFRENHKNQDISKLDVNKIRDKVLYHSKPSKANRKKMDKLRKKARKCGRGLRDLPLGAMSPT